MRTRRSRSSSDPVSPENGHRSVLLHEAIDALAIEPGDFVLDATLGGAGHAREILARLGREGAFVGIDADRDAIERAQAALARSDARLHLVTGNFRDLGRILDECGLPRVTKVLFDLGWSSYQLDSGRGFSFQKDEPLVMTYAKDPQGITASTIVNEWSESSIADVVFGWGQERYARQIAKRIVGYRAKKKIETSKELAEIVKSAVPAARRFGRIHPATKTFQALRIAVNDELGALSQGLAAAWERLKPGGRLAVISFHSIEDREVKHLFAGFAQQNGELVSKKPVSPGREEVARNPRARSAKLRVIRKTP